MKHYFKKTIPCSVTIILLVLASCTKGILDTIPLNSLSDVTAFTTGDKIIAGVNNLYAQLQNASYYGGRFLIFNEQRGDEFSQNDGNNSTGANVWNQSITASGDFLNNVWTAAYRAINSANIIIENVSTTTVISDSLKKNYVAEAKFIRAFNYFNLVQTYAKPYAMDNTSLALPLRLKGETTGGNSDMAFSTVAEVYAQVIKDLNEAEIDLPVGYATALLNASRAHKSTAIAFKTRVLLAKGDFTGVMTEASKLVPSAAPYQYSAGTVTHKLEASIATVFSGTYIGPEAVFTLPFVNASEAPGNQSALAYNYMYPILYLNTDGIISDPVFSASSPDARKAFIKTNTSGQQTLSKFSKNSVPYTDYVPVIRYAEVLLNYAEAAVSNNNLSLATSLLNAVRQRSSAGYIFPSASIATQAALLSTILKERRIELLGEGFRTPDLLRRVQTLPAKKGTAGTAPAVAPSASNYVWAIPSSEIAYNTLAPR